MKIRYFGLLIIFWCTACQEQQPSSSPNDSAAPMELEGYETKTVTDNIVFALKRNESGQVVEDGYLKDGKKNGAWTTYKDDRPTSTTSYIDGVPYGKKIEFDRLRQITSIESYQNGKLHGMRGTYRTGRPKLEEHYVNDVRHGPYRKYFERGKEQGKISQFTDYVNGKIDGKVKHYNPQGKVTVEYNYKNGKKVSGGIVE